uniref:Syntaxin N-terminal domain-containing protein n=1 Tax=Coturnix japonica TaxID=93934 RepID=A0A8C2ST97_COTJA
MRDRTRELLEARAIRAALKSMEQKVTELEALQEALLGNALPDREQKRALQAQQEELQQLTSSTRSRLQALEPSPEDIENLNSISARVRRTQHGVLLQHFLDVTGRFHAAQSRYRQRCLHRVRRHLHITGNSAVTDEELEEMLESGQSEVFVSNVSCGAPHRSVGGSMGSLWDLWGVYGSLWVPMGSLWGLYKGFMGLYGSLWVPMCLYGVSMGLYGSLWGLYGSLCASMGSLWVSMGLYGSLWGFYGVSMGSIIQEGPNKVMGSHHRGQLGARHVLIGAAICGAERPHWPHRPH